MEPTFFAQVSPKSKTDNNIIVQSERSPGGVDCSDFLTSAAVRTYRTKHCALQHMRYNDRGPECRTACKGDTNTKHNPPAQYLGLDPHAIQRHTVRLYRDPHPARCNALATADWYYPFTPTTSSAFLAIDAPIGGISCTCTATRSHSHALCNDLVITHQHYLVLKWTVGPNLCH